MREANVAEKAKLYLYLGIKEDLFIKRAFDILLSYFELILSSLLWLIFSLMIWFEDRGPIFCCQER